MGTFTFTLQSNKCTELVTLEGNDSALTIEQCDKATNPLIYNTIISIETHYSEDSKVEVIEDMRSFALSYLDGTPYAVQYTDPIVKS